MLNALDLNKKTILSLDLDYTLVNRDRGSNFVSPVNLNLLKDLASRKDFVVLPNTGREWYGFYSIYKVLPFLDQGVFASGRGIVTGLTANDVFYNKAGSLEEDLVGKVVKLVEKGVVPFVDISYFNDRVIVYNSDYIEEYKDLFFSQNPIEWFGDVLPGNVEVSQFSDIADVYRVEIPLFSEFGIEFSAEDIADVLGLSLEDYTVKKKKHYYQGEWKEDFVFARLEVKNFEIGKGRGLKFWAEKSGVDLRECNVLHVGDQDHGLINDTEVKQVIPNSLLFMVGERCNPLNPMIDKYLGLDTDLGVEEILTELVQWSG